MSVYRSAQGKSVDMSSLASKNQRVRAVSNMNVNSRGDIIDSSNRVVIPSSQKVSNSYQKTVGNRAANLTRPPVDDVQPLQEAILPQEELLEDELEYADTSEDDAEIARIKEEYARKQVEEEAKLEKKRLVEEAKAMQARLAEEAQQPAFKVKPASEAPDTFDPTKD